MNTEQVQKTAEAAMGGNVAVGSDASPWMQATLAGAMGAACDANILSRRSNLARRSWFGIPAQLAVAAGLSVNINCGSVPQIFTGDQLRLHQDLSAFNFVLTSVKVGTMEMLANPGQPVPGDVFSPLSLDAFIDMDTSTVGKPISLAVQNVTSGAADFYGAFGGFTILGC